MGKNLFQERDEWLQLDPDSKNRYLQMFERAWDKLGNPEDQEIDEWSAKLAKDREASGSHMQPSVAAVVASGVAPVVASGVAPVVASGVASEVAVEKPETPVERRQTEHNEDSKDETINKADNMDIAAQDTVEQQGAVVDQSKQTIESSNEFSQDFDEDDKKLFDFFHPSQQSKFNEQDDFQLGGVPGFETMSDNKRRKLQIYEKTPQEGVSLVPNSGNGGSCLMTKPSIPTDANDQVSEQIKTRSFDETCESPRVEAWIVRNDQSEAPVKYKISRGQEILDAEQQLSPGLEFKLVDWLGQIIDPMKLCQQGQIVRIKSIHEADTQGPPTIVNCTAGQALWDQKGWVSVGEMMFYLSILEGCIPRTNHAGKGFAR